MFVSGKWVEATRNGMLRTPAPLVCGKGAPLTREGGQTICSQKIPCTNCNIVSRSCEKKQKWEVIWKKIPASPGF